MEHTKELIEKLEGLGIAASPLDDGDGAEDEDDDWGTDNNESVDGDGDVEMEWRINATGSVRPVDRDNRNMKKKK